MLVLSRRPNESIRIGDDIEITVVEVSHTGQVRLGLRAPEDVVILRSELTGLATPFRPSGTHKAARDGVARAVREWLEGNGDVVREAVADAVWEWLEDTGGEALRGGAADE